MVHELRKRGTRFKKLLMSVDSEVRKRVAAQWCELRNRDISPFALDFCPPSPDIPGEPSELPTRSDAMTESNARSGNHATSRPAEADAPKPEGQPKPAAPPDPLAEAAREVAEYKDKLL